MEKIILITFLALFSLIAAVSYPAFIKAEEPSFIKATRRTAVLSVSKTDSPKHILSLELKVDPGGQPINSIGTVLYFPIKYLSALSIDKKDSFCDFFPDEKTDNKNGKIIISCGRPYPGIEKKAEVITINFLKKRDGLVEFKFDQDSMILANDGYGTNVLRALENKKIYINKNSR